MRSGRPSRREGLVGACRIGVVGGINMDVHLFGGKPRYSHEMLMAARYLAEPGGKGANQARAAARLGATAILVGRIGDDEFGGACLDTIRADGVGVEHVTVVPGEHTGLVVIDLVGGHHVTKVLVPGANAALGWDDVVPALPALRECDAVVTQAEVSSDLVDRLARWCMEVGIPLFLDPTPPEAVTPFALSVAEVVTPDSEETGGLTGRKVDTDVTARLAAADLLELGARRVLVKLAELGTLMATVDGVDLVPTLSVEPVDETGAGDAFMAGLAVARSLGATWRDSVFLANVASALSVSKPGLVLPTLDEVRAGWSREGVAEPFPVTVA